MNMPLLRLSFFAVMIFLVAGCSISQYHLGYHHFGNGKMGYSVVSSSSVVGIEEFEVQCAKALASGNAESIRPLLAPKLDQALDSSAVATINNRLKAVYQTDGSYERLQLVPRKTMLDEAAVKNAFDYYDLVNANYLLKGKTAAVARLYMTKIDGAIRLAGLEIVDKDQNPNGNNILIKYIFPESVDKARMTGRYNERVE